MNDAYQLFSTCSNCRVESAVVEMMDPKFAEGIPLEARCRLCGQEEALGERIRDGQRLDSIEVISEALEAWARAEGDLSVEEFCQANMCGQSAASVMQRLLEGEPVETNFDVVAYLFPSMFRGATGRGGRSAERDRMGGGGVVLAQPAASTPRAPLVTVPRSPSAPVPRLRTRPASEVMARALCSVMVADSRIRIAELHFVALTLSEAGLPALVDEDIRPWRPADLPWPDDPIAILEAMVRLAFIDRQRDGTEWRVIREFARYWRVPMTEIDALGERLLQRDASSVAVLWRGIKSLFLAEGG